MGLKCLNKIIFVLIALAILLHVNSIQYNVTNSVPNTPGGKLFDQEIGAQFAIQVMENITRFAWQVLNQTTNDERYMPDVINLYISNFTGSAGIECGNDINISSFYMGRDYSMLSSYYNTTPKFLFTSMLHHEMAHVFQWKGNYGAPRGLIEGIADYVMVKSGFYLKQVYKKPGSGSKWDEGYGVTERFLEYCDSLKEGFVADLNKMMRFKYNDSYFEDLLGKSLGQVWTEYKAFYGNI